MKKTCLCLAAIILLISLCGCNKSRVSFDENEEENKSVFDSDVDDSQSAESDAENEPEGVLSDEASYFTLDATLLNPWLYVKKNYYSSDGLLLSSNFGCVDYNFSDSRRIEYEYDISGRLKRANIFTCYSRTNVFIGEFELQFYYDFIYNETGLPFIGYKYGADGAKTDTVLIIEYYADRTIKSWKVYENKTLIDSAEYDELGRQIRVESAYCSAVFEYEGNETRVSSIYMLAFESTFNHYEICYEENAVSIDHEYIVGGKSQSSKYDVEYYSDGRTKSCKGNLSIMDGKGGYTEPVTISYEYDEGKRLTRMELLGGDDLENWIFEYKNEKLIFEEYIRFNEIKESISYRYDESGNIVQKVCEYQYPSGVNLDYITVFDYQYDCDNNIIKETKSDTDGEILELKEYEYDSNGNLVNETRIYHYGRVTKVTYEYDEFKRVLKETREDDEWIVTYENKYSEKGLVFSHCTKYDKLYGENYLVDHYYDGTSGDLIKKIETEYYNGEKLIKESIYLCGKEVKCKRSLYDSEGNLLSESVECVGDDKG